MIAEEAEIVRARAYSRGARRALLAITLACGPRLAQAEASNSHLASDALFYEARKLASEAQYQQACPKFEKAYELSPRIGILFNLADCLEHIGRTATAWGYFREVVSLSLASGQLEREAVARQRAARLVPSLSRLTIDVPAQEGVDVTRDGAPYAKDLWGTPVPVDPGEHIVQARAAGMIPREMTIEVPVGPTEVKLVIPPLELEAPTNVDAPTATRASAPEPALDRVIAAPPASAVEAHSTGPRTAGIVLATVGVAALGAGAVFGGLAAAKNNQAQSMCVNYDPALGYYRCDSQEAVTRHGELVDEARLARRLCAIGIVGGAASLASAAVLLWTSRPRAKPDTNVGLVIDERQLGLRLHGAF